MGDAGPNRFPQLIKNQQALPMPWKRLLGSWWAVGDSNPGPAD